jgi:hypothetical protein
MAKYRPFVQAVQWTGTNVIEIRQFIRANTGAINDAIITDGVLYLRRNPLDELRPEQPIPVQPTEWAVVRGNGMVEVLSDAVFIATYDLAV